MEMVVAMEILTGHAPFPVLPTCKEQEGGEKLK